MAATVAAFKFVLIGRSPRPSRVDGVLELERSRVDQSPWARPSPLSARWLDT